MRLSYVKNSILAFNILLFVQQRVDFHSNRVLDLYTSRLNFGQTSSSLFDQSFHWYKDAIIFLLIGYKLYLDLYKPSICSSKGRFPFESGFRPLYKSIKLWSNLFHQSFHWYKDAIIFLLIGLELNLELYKPSICSKKGRIPFESGFRPLY